MPVSWNDTLRIKFMTKRSHIFRPAMSNLTTLLSTSLVCESLDVETTWLTTNGKIILTVLLLWKQVYIYAIDPTQQLLEMWHSSLRCTDKRILANLRTSRNPCRSHSTACLQCKLLYSQESTSLRDSRCYNNKGSMTHTHTDIYIYICSVHQLFQIGWLQPQSISWVPITLHAHAHFKEAGYEVTSHSYVLTVLITEA